MSTHVLIFDTLTELKDAGLVASSGAAEVDAAAVILDVGAAEMVATVDIGVTAIEVDSSNELYSILVEGSNDAAFATATDIVPLAALEMGAGAVIPGAGATDSAIGRFFLQVANVRNGTTYRYLRVFHEIAGTIATGINYTAHMIRSSRRNTVRPCTFDAELEMRDAAVTTSDEAAEVDSVAKVLDVGGAIEVNGNLVVDLTAIDFTARVAAQGSLTMDVIPTDGDTITIDTTVYRFKDTPALAEDIEIGANVGESQVNLIHAIEGTGTEGVHYFAGTTAPHPTVSAATFATDISVFTARTAGTAGNAIVTTETFTPVTDVFDAATLGTTTAGVSADELYRVFVEGSDVADFATGVEPLAELILPAFETQPGAGLVDATVGRYVIPFNNERNETFFRYMRVYTDVAGSAPSINYSAYIAQSA